MKCIIVDIDGTVADCSHRQHHVQNGNRRWDLFEKLIGEDGVHRDIIEIVDMYRHKGFKVIFLSGRGEQSRAKTVTWLEDKCDYKSGHQYHGLFMRPLKDYRRDDIVKEELLDTVLALGYEPHVFLDDRDQVVALWRRLGYRCLQVQAGNF